MFTFHLEAVVPDSSQLSADAAHPAVASLARTVRDAGMRVGVALKPDTPAELVMPYLSAHMLDMVLVLTVQPGFGGQRFMPDAVHKCSLIRAAAPGLLIQVDGGITPETARAAAAAGANVLVAGSAIFGAQDPRAAMASMRAAAADAAATAAAAAAVEGAGP